MSAKCSRCQSENAFAVKCVEPNGETFECGLCMSCVILYRSKGMDCTILEDSDVPEENDYIIKKIESFDYVNNIGEVEQRLKKAQQTIEKQKENKQKKALENIEDNKTTEENICIEDIRIRREKELNRIREENANKFLRENGYEGYYEYKVLSVLDERSGCVNIEELYEQLNTFGRQGWQLKCAFTNELGKNASYIGIAGISLVKNSIQDQSVIILERFIKFKS